MNWQPDWDDAFDNMGYVKGSETLPARWADAAEKFRLKWSSIGEVQLDLKYGIHDRQSYDWFKTSNSAQGTIIFVHGGYWSKFDKSCWSQLAKGPLLNGWNVAVVSYPLAPVATIPEICASLYQAVTSLAQRHSGRIRLIGHSAGGHLVTQMICDGVLAPPVAERIDRTVSVSGLYDLRPLLNIQLNKVLRLTPETAEEASPALRKPSQIPTTFWVGANERPEFIRQNRLIAESWSLRQGCVTSKYDPGHQHFSVIDQLMKPNSELTAELLR